MNNDKVEVIGTISHDNDYLSLNDEFTESIPEIYLVGKCNNDTYYDKYCSKLFIDLSYAQSVANNLNKNPGDVGTWKVLQYQRPLTLL